MLNFPGSVPCLARAHMRCVLAQVARKIGVAGQSIDRAQAAPPRSRRRIAAFENFRGNKARQREHQAHVFLQPRAVFGKYRRVHVEVDLVNDHVVARLTINAAAMPSEISTV